MTVENLYGFLIFLGIVAVLHGIGWWRDTIIQRERDRAFWEGFKIAARGWDRDPPNTHPSAPPSP